MRRVVITGIGTINPVGHNLEESWANVKKGVCGIDFTKQIDTTDFKVKVSGEVKDYDPANFLDKREARKMDRYTQFGMIAAIDSHNLTAATSFIRIDKIRHHIRFPDIRNSCFRIP